MNYPEMQEMLERKLNEAKHDEPPNYRVTLTYEETQELIEALKFLNEID